MTNLLSRSDLEAIARNQADAYNIGDIGTRVEGNDRDAFRHAYVSALYKEFFYEAYPPGNAEGISNKKILTSHTTNNRGAGK
jgi:hypothetical protein